MDEKGGREIIDCSLGSIIILVVVVVLQQRFNVPVAMMVSVMGLGSPLLHVHEFPRQQ